MVPIAEQETVIQFNREGSRCKIWTTDSTMITRLKRLCKVSPDYYKLIKETKTQDGDPAGNYYELSDKSLVSLRSTKITRVMTEEQKQIAAERLRNMRKNSNSSQSDVDVENLDDEDEEMFDEDTLDE